MNEPEPEIKAAADKMAEALLRAKAALEKWLGANECDCSPEGHMCGRPAIENDLRRVEDALATYEVASFRSIVLGHINTLPKDKIDLADSGESDIGNFCLGLIEMPPKFYGP